LRKKICNLKIQLVEDKPYSRSEKLKWDLKTLYLIKQQRKRGETDGRKPRLRCSKRSVARPAFCGRMISNLDGSFGFENPTY
jgi:hypothetical protein